MAGADVGGRPLRVSLKRSGSKAAGGGGGLPAHPSAGALGGRETPELQPEMHHHSHQYSGHRASEPGHGRHAQPAAPHHAYPAAPERRQARSGGSSMYGGNGSSGGGGVGGVGPRGGRAGGVSRPRGVSDDASYYSAPPQPAAPRHVHPFSKTGIPHSGSHVALYQQQQPAAQQQLNGGGGYGGNHPHHAEAHHSHHSSHSSQPGGGHSGHLQHYAGYSHHHQGGYVSSDVGVYHAASAHDYRTAAHDSHRGHHIANHPSMYWVE
jgi:hypothetical protein